MNKEKPIKDLMLQHFKMYPEMQIQDVVKLIYQNEFAGGHLITNETDSLNRLQEECRNLNQRYFDAQNSCIFEEIGNGLCRLNLIVIGSSGISLKTVNRFFVSTANSVTGTIQSFEEKLNVFRRACKDNELPYSIEDVNAYLYNYKNKGYPAVSHSESYRSAYYPAYRIVKSEYMKYFDVFCKIDHLLDVKERVYVAIDGNSGAGKSTLANLISDIYDCNIFHMDDFFLRPELKTKERLEEIGGNVDYVRFRDEVIVGLHSGREFRYRVYDCKQMAFGKVVSVTPKWLNIIEGSYSMHPTLVDNYDLKIFLQIDEKEQSLRILKRNGVFMHKKFLNEWIPMENRYFSAMNIKEQSDLVLL
jgi:uridine kinase